PRFQASWGTASSSEWRVSSSWRPAKASERCALRERLEPLAVRLDPLDLRLFLTVDGGEDLGPRDTQAIRMYGPALAFSISPDVVSSRFDRKTRVLAMFRERPVSMSRSTRVSSLRLRRTSLLVCISPPIINLTIYISSD